MYVPNYNRFFTLEEPIAAKNVFLRRYPSLTPSFEKNPFTQGHEISSR